MNTNKALAETLGIQMVEEVINPPRKKVPTTKKRKTTTVIEHESPSKSVITTGEDQVQDYNLGRKTLRTLIDTGMTSMDDMKDLARQSESPRAYEVMSTMMKTIADMTKDLYDLQAKTKELNSTDDKKKDTDSRINVEKAVFVGSSADLLRKIKEEE